MSDGVQKRNQRGKRAVCHKLLRGPVHSSPISVHSVSLSGLCVEWCTVGWP